MNTLTTNVVSLTIDGHEVEALEGANLLWTAIRNDIFVPHFCADEDASAPDASCRLCWVEIEGMSKPVPACTVSVATGMVVNTRGEAALRMARTALELILASHDVDCVHCAQSGACQLQRTAGHLKVNLRRRRYKKIPRNLPVDTSGPLFAYDPNKCVLCGQCIRVCRSQSGTAALGFAHRGFVRRMTTFNDQPIGATRCQQCGDCVEVCPTGALAFSDVVAAAADVRRSRAARRS